jgi:menaquinone-dependent protoporphyrinogen oxidase
MSARILVAYATKKGSTREVAEAIADTLAEEGLLVEVRPARDAVELGPFDAVVLGGCLYMGRWHADAVAFLRRHAGSLHGRPLAVFAMGPLTLEEKDVAGARAQLDRALMRIPDVAPATAAIFGGVVDPSRLRFPFSRMPASDARDPEAIAAWAREVAALADGRSAAHDPIALVAPDAGATGAAATA